MGQQTGYKGKLLKHVDLSTAIAFIVEISDQFISE